MGRRKRFQFRLQGRAARVAAVAFGLALLALTIACVVWTSDDAAARDAPPLRSRPQPLERLDRIEGWVPSWCDEAAVAGQASNAGFTDLLFFHGSVDETGRVTLEDTAGLAAGLQACGKARTWLTITNHGGSLAAALGEEVAAHAESVLTAYTQSGCMHLDLDYESLTSAQSHALLKLAGLLAPRLPSGARLSLTLQPVDSTLRPDQRGGYRALLESQHVYTMRLMMYDYHWRGSLPGALCPLPMFERMLEDWADYAHKLTLCLPLYGYDWPRPEDTSLPRAESVQLRDLQSLAAQPGFDAVWMRDEGELAARYHGHFVALPSLRAISTRVELGLDAGVPAVSFWHLGCASAGPVVEACRRDAEPREAISYDEGANWETWLRPFKQRVCRTIVADGTVGLEQIGKARGVSPFAMHRFNEQLSGSNLRGQTVFIPE